MIDAGNGEGLLGGAKRRLKLAELLVVAHVLQFTLQIRDLRLHAQAAAETASSRGVKLSFDGNYRAQLWRKQTSDPAAVLGKLVAKAAIFFGNHRDISLLLDREFGGEGEEGRREAALAAFDTFPNLELIASTTRQVESSGAHRVSARIDRKEGEVQSEEVIIAEIVDRIGAGDAFAAGVLHGLLTGRDDHTTANTGLALSALKHSLPGDASLFGHADIDAFLAGERDVRR